MPGSHKPRYMVSAGKCSQWQATIQTNMYCLLVRFTCGFISKVEVDECD